MPAMWMIRSVAGTRYDDFRDRKVAAIGFPDIAGVAKPGVEKKALIAALQQVRPELKQHSALTAVSQVYRFVNEMRSGDFVVTYSPANRTYMVGTVSGEVEHHPEWTDQSMDLVRTVDWWANEVDRDDLSTAARNTLGSVLTVFRLGDDVRDELLAVAKGEKKAPLGGDEVEEQAFGLLSDYEAKAIERIKDLISRLDWSEMQELVAGTLRAMGYKTQVSPAGSDLGRDILASRDGFGFESPRIIVEVKHRKEAMNSQAIRSLTGGRHLDDRCLYVSTGGFTKDARYEADRSNVRVTLWTLDDLTKALIDNYENTDTKTKALISLRAVYVPAGDR
ncbi:restriction endonuclease [Mycolicibacterium celeriflavum]|uniref:restriction endonuclease n=1 Tax=Mycolicibacterium celeriflavum TaxID=1249101 RepID=UPI0007FF6E6E|nr:restriction endonuclease [Mycolicibacterium celeriflavum]OBG14935.1 restriction endonuclease [Mycolicibacterium celeriflavum]